MGGSGHVFLRESFDILLRQTFKDFDVVVSDHSKNDAISKLCDEFKSFFDIHYYRNIEGVGLSSPNINKAITLATGKLIKILFLDDFLYDETSLEVIVKHFDLENDYWMVTACEHSRDGKTFYRPFYPTYNDHIHLGWNTISSPSVLTIKNGQPLLYDENLVWLMDVEYYKRLHDAYGAPKILTAITVVNRTGEHQGTGGYRKSKREYVALQRREYYYVLKKYETGFRYLLYSLVGFVKYTVKGL